MARRITEPCLLLVATLVAALSFGACAPGRARQAERSFGTTDVNSPAASAVPRASAPATRTPPALAALVEIGDHFYSPAEITVQVGTTVTWRMVGSQEHDVWAYDGSFHSPTLGPGMRFSHTFAQAGNFKYFCIPHYGDGMYGEVIVVPRTGG